MKTAINSNLEYKKPWLSCLKDVKNIGKLKIYIGDITLLKNDAEFFGICYKSLSDFRKRKCDRYKQIPDKARCVGAGMMLDIALSEYGLSERDSIYILGENGKPSIDGHPEICFNLSHSGDRVMCAISDTPVGCDVEKIKPYRKNLDQIARRFFDENERKKIFIDAPKEAEVFYQIWTLKESYIKYTGEGMKCSFESFSVVDNLGEFAIKGNPDIGLISFKDGEYSFGAAYDNSGSHGLK